MTVQRYRRKPKQEDREDQYAARYEPGADLVDLMTVARMADSRAELAEVTIPFADRESAEAALREVEVFVRAVHDAGGEDYRPVVAGEVLAETGQP